MCRRVRHHAGWLAIFCVALLLITDLPSSFPNPRAGLRLDSSSPTSTANSFYPYALNASNYPGTDTLYSPRCSVPSNCAYNFTYPQVASVVINLVPTFLLLGISSNASGKSQAYFETGTYSSALARGIANQTSSTHLPIQWNTAVAIGAVETNISGDSLTTANDGSAIFVAISWAGQTAVYDSLKPSYGGSWNDLTPTPLSGADPQLSFGGGAALLTTVSSGTVVATTFYLVGIPSSVSETVATGVENDAVSWLPSVGMGEEAVVVSTTSNLIVLYTSTDGGHLFSHLQIANFTVAQNTSAFNSVGGTRIWNPGGLPGQLALATDGATLFVLYTTTLQGVVVAATMASYDAGTSWVGPYLTSSSAGAVDDPVVVGTPAGYFQTLWRENSQGTWAQDIATYSADGRPIVAPAQVPGTNHLNKLTQYPNSLAVDPFQRPFFAWQVQPSSSQLALRYTGAFLRPTPALNAMKAEFTQLQNWDYRSGSAAGTNGSLQTLVSNRITWAEQNASGFVNHPTTTSYLCNLQNDTGNLVYPNVTHVQLQYGQSSSLCGNLAPGLHATNSTSTNGIPKSPPNANWAPSVAMTLGPFAANSFLAVLTDWALEAEGVTVSWSADPLRTLNPTGNVLPAVSNTVFNGNYTDPTFHKTSTATVNATPQNPTTGLLSVGPASFPTYYYNWTGSQVYCGKLGVYVTIHYYETAVPYAYYSNVSVEGEPVRSFENGAGLPSVYLSNLTANATATWFGNFTAAYKGTIVEQACMTTSSTSIPPGNGIPSSVAVPVHGSVTTSLRMYPYPPRIVNLPSQNTVTYFWNNTMPANATTELTNLSYTGSGSPNTWSNGTPELLSESLQSANMYVNDWYSAQLLAISQNGRYNPSLTPAINANQMTSAPAATAGYGCTFQFTKNPVKDWGFHWSNYTAGNLTLQWNSSVNSSGWVRYYEFGVAINFTQTAQVKKVSSSQYEYFAELHGLVPSSLYELAGVTAEASGCLTFEGLNMTAFSTFNNFPLQEQDYPYDSISHTGGGALIWWNLPSNITRFASFVSGYLSYTNQSNLSQQVNVPIVAPLAPLSAWYSLYGVNLTGLGLNTSYRVTVLLNYTVIKTNQNVTFQSRPSTFIYARDTSGDGLTDWEKSSGWTVPVVNAHGGYWDAYSTPSITWVTANPTAWATNGLVNDYVEKEFDLDPNTIDTAGSHMLDMWNLTFDIGNSHSCPTTYFQCWNESSKSTGMNPFSFSQYPGGPHTGKANTTWVPPNKYPLDDGSQYDANHLWSGTGTGNALSYLEGLISGEGVGWLRAVLGYYPTNGHYTLTVWGKLSWGANPLATSTPATGVADGSRVNPLGGTDLQVSITSWANPGLSSSVGVAAFINAAYSGTKDYANYTKQWPGNSAYPGTFVVTFPVNPTYQYVNLNVSLEKHSSSGLSQILNSATLTVDLENRSLQSYSYSGGALTFQYQPLPVYARAPTWIFVPTDNSTLSSLPLGLQRYTGEQNFVLLVVNDTVSGSNSLTVSSSPYSDNSSSGAYSVSLSGGLNNLLVPRGAFINSPLGQALLNTTNVSIKWTSRNAAFESDWANVSLNGVEWYDRVVGIQPNSGYLPTHWQMNVTSNTSTQNTSNPALIGGVPGNPALEQGYQTRAIQAIFTLNESQVPDLQGMLAGLLLNKTGNFTGWLYGATNELPTLGLLPAVSTALANSTYPNDGAYGAPTYSGSQSNPPSWWLFGAGSWNVVSGIITGLKLIAMAWTAAIAAMAYSGELYAKAPLWGLQKLQQIPAVLRKASSEISSAMHSLESWVTSQLQSLFSPLTNYLKDVDAAYFSSVNSSFSLCYNDVNTGHSVSVSHANEWWTALGGPVFQGSAGIGTVLEIAVTITAPLSLGSGFLVSLLIPLILTSALQALFGQTPLGKAFTSVSGLGQVAVSMIWAVANATLLPSEIDSILFATYTEIGADVAAFALAWALLFGGLAAGAGGVQVQILGPVVVLTLAALALFADFYGKAVNSKMIEWLGVVLGGAGVGVGVYVTIKEKDPLLRILTAVGAGLSGYGALVGFSLVA